MSTWEEVSAEPWRPDPEGLTGTTLDESVRLFEIDHPQVAARLREEGRRAEAQRVAAIWGLSRPGLEPFLEILVLDPSVSLADAVRLVDTHNAAAISD